MATEVKLPELGEGIESGDVLEILVSVGDVISEGQDVLEMETDKATVPIPTSVGGKVSKINVSEGDSVPIGGVILEVEAEQGATDSGGGESGGGEPAAEPQQQAEAEPAGAADETAEQEPAAEQAPAEEEPEPAPAESKEPAPQQPAAAPKPQPKPAPQPQPKSAPQPQAAAESDEAEQEDRETIPAGPAVRRFAREVGVDLRSVRGTGSGGRITRDDVLAVVRQANQAAARGGAAPMTAESPAESRPAAAPQTSSGVDVDDYGPIRVERMSKIRKTIAKQMHASWTDVPRVTNFDDADITELEQLRQSSKEDYAAQGLKLTTMPFLIKAVATALKHHAELNATIDQENEQVIYKDYVNIGIAVDTDRGLTVPVMHNTDRLGIPEITRGLAEVASKVRGGQFAVSDLRGGTFTISNLGAIGGQYSTPMVNIPEVAILLVGRSRKVPVVMPDDSIQPRLMMPLSLSYDHRIVDGATAGRFLNDVIAFLQAPSRLLLAL